MMEEQISAQVRNREALASLQSKLRMLGKSKEAWSKQVKELGKGLEHVENELRTRQQRARSQEQEVSLTKQQAEKNADTLKDLQIKQHELEQKKKQKAKLESQIRSVWKLKESQRVLDKQYMHKKAKLDQMEHNIRSIEGGIRMFEGELKAISALSAEERRKIASPREIKELQLRLAKLTERRQKVVLERDAYAKKVNAVQEKVEDTSKLREEATNDIEQLGGKESWAGQSERTLNDKLRELSCQVKSTMRERTRSEEFVRRESVILDNIRMEMGQLEQKYNQIKSLREDAARRVSIINEAREALNNRVKRIVMATTQVAAEQKQKDQHEDSKEKKSPILGYPCSIPVRCCETKEEEGGRQRGGIGGGNVECFGKATVTAFLFLFEQQEPERTISKEEEASSSSSSSSTTAPGIAVPSTKTRNKTTTNSVTTSQNNRFCVDMEDIEAVDWRNPEKKSRSHDRKNSMLRVSIRKGHTNRFESSFVHEESDKSGGILEEEETEVGGNPRRVIAIFSSENDDESLNEFYELLKLGLLLHQATKSALPEDYSIFPRNSSIEGGGGGVATNAAAAPLKSSSLTQKTTSFFTAGVSSLFGVGSSSNSSSSNGNSSSRSRDSSSSIIGNKKSKKDKKDASGDGNGQLSKESSLSAAPSPPLPDLIIQGTSKIASANTIRRIVSLAPTNLHIEDWKLFYSLQDGADLQKMYRSVRGMRDTILLIQDSSRSVFGVFNSSYYTVEDNYYGNGLSFVFKIEKKDKDVESRGQAPLQEIRGVEKYGWSGDNELFILCKSHSLAFGGGGDGGNAIRLDKNLCSGSTEKCATFSSPELSDVAEFKIYRVELWGPAPM
mmetsp:Transcript_30297/g.49383  ORF Transcript_30297/g.49383 Transcript_30297/m.49383 type:complete len:843 (+) Transcript_30297:121-2649(+)